VVAVPNMGVLSCPDSYRSLLYNDSWADTISH